MLLVWHMSPGPTALARVNESMLITEGGLITARGIVAHVYGPDLPTAHEPRSSVITVRADGRRG